MSHCAGLREKALKVVMTSFSGTTPADVITSPDLTPCPGGVILFDWNIRSSDQMRVLTAALRRKGGPDLLIAVDQEGGYVTRFDSSHGFTDFPGNMALGAISVPRAPAGPAGTAADFARAAATAMGRELSAVGVNMNMAPVLDVNNNPANPIIGERSFGESPELVAELGLEAIRGYLDAGVIPVGKHFPGHGDTDIDSHYGLPRIPHDLERLRAMELRPYVRAMAAGPVARLPAVMTAHVVFSAAGLSDSAGLPATLSRPVLSGLLRGELGFGGAIVTDALEMAAISADWSVGEASVLSLQAGADILLVCHSGLAAEVAEAVTGAVRSGSLPEARLDEAVTRVETLKARLGRSQEQPAYPRRPRPEPATPVSAEPGWPSSPEHRRLAEDIARRSLTLVRNENHLLPLDPSCAGRWLVVTPAPALGEIAAQAHPNSAALLYDPRAVSDSGFIDQAAAAATEAAAVILATRSSGGGSPEPLARALSDVTRSRDRPLVWISLGPPYELALAPDAPVFLAAYSIRRPSLEAAMSVITGCSAPMGRLPVSIPGLYRAGHGLKSLL